ncbi:MAG: 2-amino-4-hydroxy-6-hydroxymethyldihydropteridine diphosphokinase [Saprospiraceae bacterium]|uniref:2-amino-4-hydroxy-6-hydroxymethyldihydropteridine pyrophosphokinase n=1 Tax=Candidatus Opimibacter skivensis TaxID=2982028 RepID=A0A9D7ST94_9BACT|nr:2-amino-4-hydroxy-6-hydroxymethyldihydropteridine diphosphokinase [Candidatus Opimibacter skivensis]
MHTSIYHLSLGSNLGDRIAQLNQAKNLIATQLGTIKAESKIYETQPWGYDDQPWFLNQAIALSSTLESTDVLKAIKLIEIQAGRIPGEKWHARHIDIDILLHGDEVINTENLTIPHPLFHERNFALIPLMDIASQIVHPVLQQTIEELYLDCRDSGEVYIFNADEQDNAV